MQPKMDRRRPALGLLQHEPRHVKAGGEGSQGWAISYADLLMVLLCLFIGLSVVDDSTKKDDKTLEEIAVAFRNGEKPAENGKTNPPVGNLKVEEVPGKVGAGTQAAKDLENSIYDSLTTTLEKIGVQSELIQERNQILLKFETNLYEKGQIDLDDKAKAKLEEVLLSLDSYKNKIELSVVGHTDKTPVRQMKTRAIQENIDLAVLRASNATKWIRDRGFPQDDLSIEVSDPQADDRRSISLHVRVKPVLSTEGKTE